MILNRKITFLTFADSRFLSWKRLKKQAKQTGWFDEVVAGNESMFDSWYFKKYKYRFKDRGYGYWQWKSYLIRRELDKLNGGDVLLYCDGGCTLNGGGYSRFVDYVKLVSTHPSGILIFEQEGQSVRMWTKGDVFAYFGNEERYTSHDQIGGAILMICKNAKSCALVDEWYYICHNHYELLTDELSRYPNYPEFVEHRHDQSVMDLLVVKYNGLKLPLYEIYTDDRDWSKLRPYPIWTTRQRDKKPPFILKRVMSKIKKMLMNKK